MAQQAYQYDRRNLREHDRRPDIQVKKGGAPRAQVSLRLVRAMALTAVLLALVCSVLFSDAQLSALTMDLQETRSELKEEQNNHSYLSGKLNSKTNMRSVEDAAKNELGLVKLDPSQVTYFTLDGEGQVDKPRSETQKLAGWVLSGMGDLMEDLDP